MPVGLACTALGQGRWARAAAGCPGSLGLKRALRGQDTLPAGLVAAGKDCHWWEQCWPATPRAGLGAVLEGEPDKDTLSFGFLCALHSVPLRPAEAGSLHVSSGHEGPACLKGSAKVKGLQTQPTPEIRGVARVLSSHHQCWGLGTCLMPVPPEADMWGQGGLCRGWVGCAHLSAKFKVVPGVLEAQSGFGGSSRALSSSFCGHLLFPQRAAQHRRMAPQQLHPAGASLPVLGSLCHMQGASNTVTCQHSVGPGIPFCSPQFFSTLNSHHFCSRTFQKLLLNKSSTLCFTCHPTA